MSPPGLPAWCEGWGQEGMAEGTAGTGACGVTARSCTGDGPTGQQGAGGSCSAAGSGGSLASPMDAQNAQGAVPWVLLGLSGRMSRVGVPACDVVVLE